MSFVARPDERLHAFLREQFGKVPNLEPCWKAALTKLEANPNIGAAIGGDVGGLRGVRFPSPQDREKNPATSMFPTLLIAYSVSRTAITVHEVKIKT